MGKAAVGKPPDSRRAFLGRQLHDAADAFGHGCVVQHDGAALRAVPRVAGDMQVQRQFISAGSIQPEQIVRAVPLESILEPADTALAAAQEQQIFPRSLAVKGLRRALNALPRLGMVGRDQR